MSAAVPRIAVILVAAVAENGVIGRDHTLPWRIKSDLARFRAITMGKPVVMGRRTFLSIGKPLSGRTNIVISRNADYTAPGIEVAPSLDAGLAIARGDALRRGANAIAVIGGTEIFAQCMPSADRLDITLVHARPAGDSHFPQIDAKVWSEVERNEHLAGPEDDAGFAQITYIRA